MAGSRCGCESSLLLLLVLALALTLKSPALARSHCAARIATVAIEDSLCGTCYYVNTTICQGACVTKQSYARHGRSVQRACVYAEVRYETAALPGCAARPLAATTAVPSAVSCACRRCDTRTTDCTERSVGPDFCRLRGGG
ncbi:follitropin subunit beta-like [Petromyzon marinus]|uniref:follitropin subunit beta-like n=1 Tax=Petromyzon marinus TaxID=7757 RepID=UPI003F6EE821